MTQEEVSEALKVVYRKAVNAVGYLARPVADHCFIYEMARFHITHLVGPDAIHSEEASIRNPSALLEAIDHLSQELDRAAKEADKPGYS